MDTATSSLFESSPLTNATWQTDSNQENKPKKVSIKPKRNGKILKKDWFFDKFGDKEQRN